MNKTIFEPVYRKLVAELRQARRRAGLTQEAAGRVVGRSRQWVHKAESCEIRLDVVQTSLFCRAYGISLQKLVRELGGADG
jgi:DNA-binding XRE family transcriptional regulator